MKNEFVGVRFALAFVAVLPLCFFAQPLRGAETAAVAGGQGDFFCGPRCVQQVLRFYGQRLDLYDLVSANRYDGAAQGASMSDLREMLARRQIHSLAIEMPRSISKTWPGPMIAHLPPKLDGAIGHWVTVTPTDTAGEYSVFYGLLDTRILTWDELLAATSGHALLTSEDPISAAVVRASWPRAWSYVSVVAGCAMVALGLLRAKRAQLYRCPSLSRARFALALAGVAGALGCAILFQKEPALRVLAACEMMAVRGGDGVPSCGSPGCWTSGPDTQCGTPYTAQRCSQSPCPVDGDCTAEMDITVQNGTAIRIYCALDVAGKSGYDYSSIVCSSARECDPFCADNGDGQLVCSSDTFSAWAPISTDNNELLDPAAGNCIINIADGPRESSRSPTAIAFYFSAKLSRMRSKTSVERLAL